MGWGVKFRGFFEPDGSWFGGCRRGMAAWWEAARTRRGRAKKLEMWCVASGEEKAWYGGSHVKGR